MELSDNIENLTDQHLFSLISASNTEAYEVIYNRFSGILILHAFQMLQDRDEARDVVQEVFIAIWEKRSRLIDIQNPSGFLYVSTRNLVLDKIAKHKNKNKYLDSFITFLKDQKLEGADTYLYEKELKGIIEREVSKLPEKMQQVFRMSREDQLSHKEISQELRISEKTVRKQVSNALKVLRKRLDFRYFKNILILLYSLFLN